MKQIITVLTGIFLSSFVLAQNKVVYGKLTTFNTYPVQNIEVTAKKAKTTVTSDSLGQFSIVCFENDVIRIKKRLNQIQTLCLLTCFLLTPNRTGNWQSDMVISIKRISFDLIKGRFSGVTVSGNNVYIRGSGSFVGPTRALYILNGIETSSIDWISPCEIKSIDILKDSNAAIYGTRGANGVVLINTNK